MALHIAVDEGRSSAVHELRPDVVSQEHVSNCVGTAPAELARCRSLCGPGGGERESYWERLELKYGDDDGTTYDSAQIKCSAALVQQREERATLAPLHDDEEVGGLEGGADEEDDVWMPQLAAEEEVRTAGWRSDGER